MYIEYFEKKRTLYIFLSGDYICYDDLHVKENLFNQLRGKNLEHIVFKNKALKSWDSSLLLILYQVLQKTEGKKITLDFSDLPLGLQRLLNLSVSVDRKPPHLQIKQISFLEKVGDKMIFCQKAIIKTTTFILSVFNSIKRFIGHRAIMRQIDFFFAFEDAGPKAVGIVSLISFMVGLILAFVGAIQLQTFGAQIYIASLVTIGMIRIMGAIMTGIIMAGRTGSSYAATIGTMQVNEEVDALKTMGIPVNDFLVLPRLFALTLSMPFLTVLADFMGMLGGGFVGVILLGIPMPEYIKFSIEAFGLTNFLVGIFHGLIFGIVIALCGCYCGIHCGKDADSVGKATTLAVVSSIVWMIVMTGIITLIFQGLGV